MECLICSDSICHVRMGVNACRACAAFYKRTIGHLGWLKCKDGRSKCWEKNPKTTCRKCRMKRFKDVLKRASSTALAREAMDIPPASGRLSAFVDHTSFLDSEPASSQTPLLHRIRKGYSLMCLIRKAGETALKTERAEENVVRVDKLDLTRATYSKVMPNTRLAKEAIIEFANLAFEDFRSLEESCKEEVIEKSYSMMNMLESTYRCCHHFPNDSEIRLPSYTTYLRMTDLEHFFSDCTDAVDRTNLIKQFKAYMEQSAKIVRQHFDTARPTDLEFLALFGLALWNDDMMSLDGNLPRIARRIRAEIMKELHAYYAMTGTVDYAARVGNIFCLLVNCQSYSAKTLEDFQVFRLLNLFEGVFSES